MPDILTLEERLAEIRLRGYGRGETGDMANRLSDCAAIDVPRLLAAVEAVLELHAEFRIYDECGHEHTQDEIDAGTARDTTEFVTCEDGYVYSYSVCRACCTGGWSQTEACASDHERPCWPCGTREALSAALLAEDGSDGS